MAQWEYPTVLVSQETLDYEALHPKSVNGQDLKNWKHIDLTAFLSQLGADHWEMTGTLKIEPESAREHYLFFKRYRSSECPDPKDAV